MKKLILLIFVVMTSVCALMGKDGTAPSKRNLPITIKTRQTEFKKHRAPMRVPIEVVYDSNTQIIEVSTDSELEGEACLYHDGTVIDSASQINTTFQLPYEVGEYTVVITNDSWEAIAELIL